MSLVIRSTLHPTINQSQLPVTDPASAGSHSGPKPQTKQPDSEGRKHTFLGSTPRGNSRGDQTTPNLSCRRRRRGRKDLQYKSAGRALLAAIKSRSLVSKPFWLNGRTQLPAQVGEFSGNTLHLAAFATHFGSTRYWLCAVVCLAGQGLNVRGHPNRCRHHSLHSWGKYQMPSSGAKQLLLVVPLLGVWCDFLTTYLPDHSASGIRRRAERISTAQLRIVHTASTYLGSQALAVCAEMKTNYALFSNNGEYL